MELRKKQIHCLQFGRRIMDQFYLDEDFNVPDAKEDVQKIIYSKAEVRVDDLQSVENYLRVAGKMKFFILYTPARMEPRLDVLEGSFPFEEMVYLEGETKGQHFIRNLRVDFMPNLIHSRKIGIRAMIELEIHSEQLRDEEITCAVEDEASLFCKYKSLPVLQLTMTKKDTYRIKEEFTLPGTKDGIGKLLFSDISDRKMDIRLGQDELIIKGDLLVFCLYLSEDLKADWVEQTVPFEGRVECSGVEPGMYHQVRAVLEDSLLDIRMDEDGEMRVLGIEGTLALGISVFAEESAETLEDVYSVHEKCDVQTRMASFEELLIQNQSKYRLAEQLSLPELKEDVLQICHSEGSLQLEQMKVMPEGIYLEGILHFSFLYVKADDDSPFSSWQGMIPFVHLLECPGICEDALYQIVPHLEQLTVSFAGSQNIEVKAVMTFDTFVRRPVQMQMIDDIVLKPVTEEERETMPGIVGYVVKEGDSLWKIAKHFMTTEDVIKNVNQLESEHLKNGEKLLIFKDNDFTFS